MQIVLERTGVASSSINHPVEQRSNEKENINLQVEKTNGVFSDDLLVSLGYVIVLLVYARICSNISQAVQCVGVQAHII